MARWDARDVSTWITKCLKLPYGPVFEAAGIDGYALVELTKEDLEQKLGVEDAQHVQQLEAYISIFRSLIGKQKNADTEAPPAGAAPPATTAEAPLPQEIPSASAPAPLGMPARPPTELARPQFAARSDAGPVTRRQSQPEPSRASLGSASRLTPKRMHSASHSLAENLRPQTAPANQSGPSQQRVPLHQPVPRGQSPVRRKDPPPRQSTSPQQRFTSPSRQSQSSRRSLGRPTESSAGGVEAPRPQTDIGRPTASSRASALVRKGHDFKDGGQLAGGAGLNTQSFESLTTAATQNTANGLSRNTSQQSVNLAGVVLQPDDPSMNDSLLGWDRHPSFTQTSTGRWQWNEPSPGHYSGQCSQLSRSSATFGTAERNTGDSMLLRGKNSPGVGRYSPSPRGSIRGGTIPKTQRWNPPSSRSPGPQTYRPKHIALSTLK